MKIIKNFKNNEFVYDSVKSKKNKIEIEIEDDEIKVNYDEIIDCFFNQGNISNLSFKKELFEFLNLGINSKAPSGGFINLFQIKSKKNQTYIIFSGVKEVSNSYFIVDVHKVIKK